VNAGQKVLLTTDPAERYAEVRLDHATRHAMAHWGAFGRSYQGPLAIARGDVIKGLPLLYAGSDGKAGLVTALRLIDFLVAEPLGRAGRTADGLALVEEALVPAESTEERWHIAELHRVKGELFFAGHAHSSGCRRGSLPTGPRLGRSARRALLGIAGGHQPRPPLARSGPSR
jgi:hypothetical protein